MLEGLCCRQLAEFGDRGVKLIFVNTVMAKPRAVAFLFIFAALSFFYTTSHSADLPSSHG